MQTGNITSVDSQSWASQNTGNWIVNFTYVLDAGGLGNFQVVIGSGQTATVPLWASPNSTVSVTAPGYTANILLDCPDLIKFSAFGQRIKGLPTQ